MADVAAHPLPQHVATILDRDWSMLVGGDLAAARSGRTFTRVSPYTETAIAEVPDGDVSDVDAAVLAADAARVTWRATPASERARLVRELADAVEAHGEELALLDTADAGSPISNSRADVAIGVASLRMFAGLGAGDEGHHDSGGRRTCTTRCANRSAWSPGSCPTTIR